MYQALEATRSSWRWWSKSKKAAYKAALGLAVRVPIEKSGHHSGIFVVSKLSFYHKAIIRLCIFN